MHEELCKRVAKKVGLDLDEENGRIYFPVGEDGGVASEHVTTLNTPGGRYLLERYLEELDPPYYVQYENRRTSKVKVLNGGGKHGELEHVYGIKDCRGKMIAGAVSEFVPFALLNAIDEALPDPETKGAA